MFRKIKKEKPSYSEGDNLLFLLSHAWQWDKVLFLYFTMYTILTAVSPFINIIGVKLMIDELLGAARIEVLGVILGSMFCLQSVINFGVTYLQNLYSPKLIFVRFKFINMLQVKNMTMDFKHTENPETLNQMEAAWQSVNSNHQGIEGTFHSIFNLMGNALSFLGYITLVLTLSPWVLLYLVVNVMIMYVFMMRVKTFEHDQKEDIAAMDRRANYLFNTMSDFSFGKDIRMYQLSNWLGQSFKREKSNRLERTKIIQRKYLIVKLVDVLFMMLREGLIYAYLIFCVLYKGLSMGDFTMYFTTIGNFANLMKSVMDEFSNLRVQMKYVNGYREFIALQDEADPVKPKKIPTSTPYDIEFRNVSFKYPNSERFIYENLSFKIKAGQRLAIVGINGAGKTTLVKLLTRLYEPTTGEILLNGINIKQFKKADYYELFSVVFQDIKILGFSVAENVGSASRWELNDELIVTSLKSAGVYEKISSLSKGIDTPLLKVLEDDGVELSGGQNQKLALARALYKNGDIVILDEPTAALDAVAEYEIYQNFDQLVQQKTAIYISHRLSSTRFCDAIAYFEHGKILEYGTHDELLDLGGKYAEMFNVQSQYYVATTSEGVAS
ncbi:MAG TPA: ABC transporter [Firmicutes bacterium]|nr:ABC transporter [Bacillota bacterium]